MFMACIYFELFIADCTMNGLALNVVEGSFMTHDIQAPLLLTL